MSKEIKPSAFKPVLDRQQAARILRLVVRRLKNRAESEFAMSSPVQFHLTEEAKVTLGNNV
jgi:hypothetical protein